MARMTRMVGEVILAERTDQIGFLVGVVECFWQNEVDNGGMEMAVGGEGCASQCETGVSPVGRVWGVKVAPGQGGKKSWPAPDSRDG